MTRQEKVDKINRLIDAYLSVQTDNATRARLQFGAMTDLQLNQEYGESGRTCKEILDEFLHEMEEAKELKEWFKSIV